LFQWPKEDQELRNEARRAMEISLWKALLKVKWHHMTSDNDPGFLLKYTETDKATFEKANPNHWVEFHPGTHDEGFGKKRNGFFVTHHWLGYGSEAIWHHQPEPSMCDRLFKDLNVSRQEVFKDDSWGLVSESLHCPESRDAPNFHGGM
jgi:hypothetical protein